VREVIRSSPSLFRSSRFNRSHGGQRRSGSRAKAVYVAFIGGIDNASRMFDRILRNTKVDPSTASLPEIALRSVIISAFLSISYIPDRVYFRSLSPREKLAIPPRMRL